MDQQPPNPPTPSTPGRSRFGVFLAIALVASVIWLAWVLHGRFYAFIQKQLSVSRSIGSLYIVPEGYASTGLFRHSWNRIQILMPGLRLDLIGPDIRLNLFEDLAREMILVQLDSLDGRLYPEQLPPGDTTSMDHLRHPDLWLPFRTALRIGHVNFKVNNIGQWSGDSLYLGNPGQKNLFLRMNHMQGTYIASPLHPRIAYNWGRRFADAMIRVSSDLGDTIQLSANASRTELEDLSCELEVRLPQLAAWIPGGWPDGAPQLGRIQLNADALVNLLTLQARYEAEVRTRSAAFWQLPDFNVLATVKGNERLQLQTQVSLTNPAGQKITASAQLDSGLNGTAQAEISGVSLEIGPELQPADLKIHRLIKKGDSLHATITTQAGSEIIGTLKDFKDPRIHFQASIAPQEPWAVKWTGEHVRLAPPTLIEGDFNRGILSANVRSRVPFAYWASADQFEVDLTLSGKGIHFDNGSIRTPGQLHTFNGEVIWNDSIPHFLFFLEQNSDRFARVYGTFEADLELSLAGIDIAALPLADTSMLRGYGGTVSGIWKHSFSQSYGQAEVSLSTTIKDLPLQARILARQNQDSMIVEHLIVQQGTNQLEASLLALRTTDSTADTSSIRLERASASTRNFNIPEIALAFQDSTLTNGTVSGDLNYIHQQGLQGGLTFSNLMLRGIDTSQFRIIRLRLFSQDQNLQLSGRFSVGDGLWNGEAEVTFDSLFTRNSHRLAGAYATDNGGVFWFDGSVDSLFQGWNGQVNLNGSWFLPPGAGEITATDFSARLQIPFKGGLPAIRGTFHTQKTEYLLGTSLGLPIEFHGYLEKGRLRLDSLFLHNAEQETLKGTLLFDIPTRQLMDLAFSSDGYTLPLQGPHKIRIQNLSARTETQGRDQFIHLDIPGLQYHLNDKTYGKADALARAQLRFRIPGKIDANTQTNNSIEGQVSIDKAIYRKELDIAPDPLHLDRTLNSLGKMLANLRKEKPSTQQPQALSGRPTTLNIRINDTSRDSMMIISNLATFPLSVDMTILGTTQSPLLTGDINAIGTGFIGYEGLATFEIDAFRLYWQDSPWRRGQIDLQTSHDFPFCEEQNSEDTCPIEFNVTGTLTNPQPQPIANCGIESSPALIYYSILLGCVSQNSQSEGFDKNKFTGRLLGNLLTSTANKGLGGAYIGDIDLKMKIFDNSSVQERDSSYLRIPVSLNKWVKNLSAIFGYTQDQSINPRYDQSVEVGLQYTLPIFDPAEINMNLIDPRLDLSANLISRRYPATMETQREESRLEKNIGLLYSYKFWDPCFLGFGTCTQLEYQPVQEEPPQP